MNHRVVLSYFLVMGFFVCLIFAYMKYSNNTLETETDKLRQDIITSLDKEISALRQQIEELQSKSQNNMTDNMLGPVEQQNIIKAFIQNNPEIIAQTLEDFYKRKSIVEQKQSIDKNLNELFNDIKSGNFSTFVGSQDAPIKIVEFFDYSCGFCKQMLGINNEITKNNPDVAFIFVELPVLGAESLEATRIATAVSMIDRSKYLPFQTALFNLPAPRDGDSIINLAKQVGIESKQLQEFLNNNDNIAKIEARIKKNNMIAHNMQLQGTPTYIIGEEILVGATSQQQLTDAIAKTRAKIAERK